MDALHPKREPQQSEQKSPAIADEKKQSTPHQECPPRTSSPVEQRHQKVKLTDVISSLTCDLCKGYLIDATTISECLHSFCRSCIIKFLEENSFCPVCEVIINKAKPNLKLDKTLQDIVYKLVPGLFLSEMMRRRKFYAERPTEAARVLPEQRGEDTERTIFNPQDKISLSLEYIGDAATTGLILKDLKQKQPVASDDLQVESLLKRYLQCPAMCRVDVIKKFIRNKFNVNTDLFQIDILYKRVPLPLPDHYTLIDVAYIYTWKRNEPMRFYFRIIDKDNDELPDLTKVFTPAEDAPFLHQPLALSTPHRVTRAFPAPNAKEKNKKTPKRKVSRKLSVSKSAKKEKKNNAICDKPKEEGETKRKRYVSELEEEDDTREKCSGSSSKLPKIDDAQPVSDQKDVVSERCDEGNSAVEGQTDVETKPDTDRVKNETPVVACDNGKVYTNITLNRTNNVEIVTKIQKLSDKDGQQIEVNVIDQNTRQKSDTKSVFDDQSADATPSSSSEEVEIKSETETKICDSASTTIKEEVSALSEVAPESKPDAALPCSEAKHEIPFPEVSSTTNDLPAVDEELEKTKFEFLKSIELTAKRVVDNIAKMVQQQQQKNATSTASRSESSQNQSCSQHATLPINAKEVEKSKKPSLLPKPVSNVFKRKNYSPIKNEPKRTKVEQKRTTKIILQQKPGYPPLNLSKPTGTTEMPEELIKQNRNELRSLFQTCRLNIPASLSITLKENGETSRQPVQMPPVQNFIEILKIDDKEGTKAVSLTREEAMAKNIDVRNAAGAELKVKELPAINCGTTSQLPNSISPLSNITKLQVEQMQKIPKEAKEALTKLQKDQQSFQKIFEESIKKTGSSSNPNIDVSNGSGKKKILEIAQQLYKKTKNEHDTKKNVAKPPMASPTPSGASSSTSSCVTPPITVPNVQKIAIPRLNNQRVVKPPKRNQKYENTTHQTLTNLHSSSLGLNYTVSVGKQSRDLLKNPYIPNGIMPSPSGVPDSVKNGEIHGQASSRNSIERSISNLGYVAQSSPISPKTAAVKEEMNSSKNPKVMHSPKPSIASPAPKTEYGSLPPPQSFSPRSFPTQSSPKPRPSNPSPKPRFGNPSPKPRSSNSSPRPRTSNSSPKPRPNFSSTLPTSSSSSSAVPPLTANELLEKYNIQNLAQLSASMNFNAGATPQAFMNTMNGKQMTALHQAMLMNELHNRQNWFNINQAPLLQFEKYLQNLNATKNQIMGNLKDN